MKIERRPLDALVPYARNARTHSDEQIGEIAASIAAFGFNDPIAIDGDGVIIEGHGRVLAARNLGLPHVPVIVLSHMTEAQKRAYILAHNRIAERAGWDEALLKLELADLRSFEVDLAPLGLDDFTFKVADVVPDEGETPPVPAKPKTKRGDLYLLGEHRLLCGDCTADKDVGAAINGNAPSLMVTDPPYGVDYDPNWRNVEAAKGNLAYAARRVGTVKNDDRVDWREAWTLFHGDIAYCWHADRHASSVQASLESAGFEIRCQLIWSKSNFPISRGHYHWRHEPCWYAVRKGATGNWHGDRKQTTVWEINLDQNVDGGHSTQKPVECMQRPMLNNSALGDWVYDPFVGSGTSIVAAEAAERRCVALEIDPGYVDVSVARWEALTGRSAERKRGKR